MDHPCGTSRAAQFRYRLSRGWGHFRWPLSRALGPLPKGGCHGGDPWIVAAALFALGVIGWTDRCIARARRVFGKTSRSLRKHRSDRERDPALSRGCS